MYYCTYGVGGVCPLVSTVVSAACGYLLYMMGAAVAACFGMDDENPVHGAVVGSIASTLSIID
jgi:hypothetical protein